MKPLDIGSEAHADPNSPARQAFREGMRDTQPNAGGMEVVGSKETSDPITDAAEAFKPATLWRDGPEVKISLPNRQMEKYKSQSLVDASMILFLPSKEDGFSNWTALEGHPFWSIARSIERTEWHVPSEKALEAIGSSPTLGSVCLFGLETHFVRAPLGDTFSACRLGLAARELGGVQHVAVVGLTMGDILLVKGASGYGAIARRAKPVGSAPVLWG